MKMYKKLVRERISQLCTTDEQVCTSLIVDQIFLRGKKNRAS